MNQSVNKLHFYMFVFILLDYSAVKTLQMVCRYFLNSKKDLALCM